MHDDSKDLAQNRAEADYIRKMVKAERALFDGR